MTTLYDFKNIAPVHTSPELIDVVLSKTQRKTPTVVHPGYQISRIRGFYMRKVKFVAESFIEKFDGILNGFPKLNDIHPFFADLLNVLYDKDHYKIALGQVNVVKSIVEKIAKDYVKLMKYGDSLYRCKALKIAAFGRMCTAVKKIKPSLEYLEEVRKHLGRLPCIDPFLPTILLFGYPNVGKSSLMNKMTKANVEISSMPFSTENLFVGHSEFKNVKIQFIDSPGVLDRPLENRNTIEMQSITALAHLNSMVVFMVDVSESCGYSLDDQLQLFQSLNPLFGKKPTMLVLNKIDLCPIDALDQEQTSFLQNFKNINPNVQIVELSTGDDQMVQDFKKHSCNQLMKFRTQGKTFENNLNKLKTDEDYFFGVRLFHPTQKRGNKNRQSFIPESVIQEKQKGKLKRKTLKDFQDETGGAGVFVFPMNEHFILENELWKKDKVPEIMDGQNIIDYVDPEIEKKLAILEEEQKQLKIPDEEMIDEMEVEEDGALEQVRDTIYKTRLDTQLNKNRRTVKKHKIDLNIVKRRLEAKGRNSKKFEKRSQEKLAKRRSSKMRREMSKMTIEEPKSYRYKKSERAKWNDPKSKLVKRSRKIQKKRFTQGQSGVGDHRIFVKKPKHLFAGKMGNGTSNKR